MSRPLTAGPEEGPEPPFPIKVSGRIIKGFGRGSKELGIPTANIPITGLSVGGHSDIDSGVYYGWAGLCRDASVTTDRSKAADPVNPNSDPSETSAAAGQTPTPTHNGASRVDVFPMVMSIGWNPFYGNKVRSVEVHIMHEFTADFYNAKMNLSILGFIRPERDYDSMDALIEDIKTDIEVSRRSLTRPAYTVLKTEEYLTDFNWD